MGEESGNVACNEFTLGRSSLFGDSLGENLVEDQEFWGVGSELNLRLSPACGLPAASRGRSHQVSSGPDAGSLGSGLDSTKSVCMVIPTS